jgi:hypothetical protein
VISRKCEVILIGGNVKGGGKVVVTPVLFLDEGFIRDWTSGSPDL